MLEKPLPFRGRVGAKIGSLSLRLTATQEAKAASKHQLGVVQGGELTLVAKMIAKGFRRDVEGLSNRERIIAKWLARLQAVEDGHTQVSQIEGQQQTVEARLAGLRQTEQQLEDVRIRIRLRGVEYQKGRKSLDEANDAANQEKQRLDDARRQVQVGLVSSSALVLPLIFPGSRSVARSVLPERPIIFEEPKAQPPTELTDHQKAVATLQLHAGITMLMGGQPLRGGAGLFLDELYSAYKSGTIVPRDFFNSFPEVSRAFVSNTVRQLRKLLSRFNLVLENKQSGKRMIGWQVYPAPGQEVPSIEEIKYLTVRGVRLYGLEATLLESLVPSYHGLDQQGQPLWMSRVDLAKALIPDLNDPDSIGQRGTFLNDRFRHLVARVGEKISGAGLGIERKLEGNKHDMRLVDIVQQTKTQLPGGNLGTFVLLLQEAERDGRLITREELAAALPSNRQERVGEYFRRAGRYFNGLPLVLGSNGRVTGVDFTRGAAPAGSALVRGEAGVAIIESKPLKPSTWKRINAIINDSEGQVSDHDIARIARLLGITKNGTTIRTKVFGVVTGEYWKRTRGLPDLAPEDRYSRFAVICSKLGTRRTNGELLKTLPAPDISDKAEAPISVEFPNDLQIMTALIQRNSVYQRD